LHPALDAQAENESFISAAHIVVFRMAALCQKQTRSFPVRMWRRASIPWLLPKPAAARTKSRFSLARRTTPRTSRAGVPAYCSYYNDQEESLSGLTVSGPDARISEKEGTAEVTHEERPAESQEQGYLFQPAE